VSPRLKIILFTVTPVHHWLGSTYSDTNAPVNNQSPAHANEHCLDCLNCLASNSPDSIPLECDHHWPSTRHLTRTLFTYQSPRTYHRLKSCVDVQPPRDGIQPPRKPRTPGCIFTRRESAPRQPIPIAWSSPSALPRWALPTTASGTADARRLDRQTSRTAYRKYIKT